MGCDDEQEEYNYYIQKESEIYLKRFICSTLQSRYRERDKNGEGNERRRDKCLIESFWVGKERNINRSKERRKKRQHAGHTIALVGDYYTAKIRKIITKVCCLLAYFI